MAQIKLISEYFNKYITENDIKELVEGFNSYHEKRYSKYPKEKDLRNDYNYKTILDIVNNKYDKEDKQLCLAYDEEAKRTIGIAFGGKSLNKPGNQWSLSFLYLQNNYRNKEINGEKVSTRLYNEFESCVINKGCEKLALGVYCRNTDALAFYNKQGYKIKLNNFQEKITILNSVDSLLDNVNKNKVKKLGMELLEMEKPLK